MRFGSEKYGRYINKLRKKGSLSKENKKLSFLKVSKTKGYQGKKSRWIGVNELPSHFINDKRDYYRNIYLKSDHWKSLRARKLKHNSACEDCGTNKKRLDVHHVDYKNLYDVTLKDLRTLCRKCHKKLH